MSESKPRKESKKEKRDRKKEKKDKKDKRDELASKSEQVITEKDVEVSEDEVTAEFSGSAEPQDQTASSGDENEDKEIPAAEDEIEIDLKAQVPLSKKQQRLMKKGKLDMEKLAKKHPTPKAADDETEEKPAKSQFGVWIGNLSYDTIKEEIIRFIVAKTAGFDDDTENEFVTVKEADISRVNLPKKANKAKGFAYVDLPSAKYVDSVVALSEQVLNGRKLLIKNSSSFEGRPEGDGAKALSKNPPSRILFVGNLSFDTSEDNLEEHFRHCGEIVRIRMATFQDSGKCKGFAFIDFKDENGPTTALKSKLAKKLINRPLRLEYGEDRSKRNPRRADAETHGEEPVARERPTQESETFDRPQARERAPRPAKRTFREREPDHSNKRLKSSVALATAQRASAAIVPSQGKKTTFD